MTVLPLPIGDPPLVMQIEARLKRFSAGMRARASSAREPELSVLGQIRHDHTEGCAILVGPHEGAFLLGYQQLCFEFRAEPARGEIVIAVMAQTQLVSLN